MPNDKNNPLPLYDALEYIEKNAINPNHYTGFCNSDYKETLNFLSAYKGKKGTFNAYRRETERLLHWSWSILRTTLPKLKRQDIESYIKFCQSPPKHWIGFKKSPRFIENKQGLRIPNPNWRPFNITLSKAQHQQGLTPKLANYQPSQATIREVFAILSTYFNFLLEQEYIPANPVRLIRQKSQFIRKYQGQNKIRRLSEFQWQYVLSTVKNMAIENPAKHERSLFILSILYSLYLRISELCATQEWCPQMSDFQCDSEKNWWFTTLGKGNKERKIAVSHAMLEALKRWRKHLGLSALPHPADNSPLIPKLKEQGPLTSTTYVRELLQDCFNETRHSLIRDGFQEDADLILEVTVHWLRHTGISDDVKRRPREHVRDDAGHSSSATTDKYIDIELRERHNSAKDKPLFDDE